MYIYTHVYRYTCISIHMYIDIFTYNIYIYTHIHKHTCISYLPPLVQDLTQWPAQTCCSSYPQTLCFPNAEEMTPCTHKAESWLNTTHQKQPVTRCGIARHSWRFLKKGGYSKIGRMSNVGDNVWCLRLSCRIILGYPILRNTSLNVPAGFGCKRTIGKL